MKEPKPPFIFDWDGDVQFYSSMKHALAAFEPQDLESLKNRILFDAQGMRFVLSLVDSEAKTPLQKWDFNYPVKAFQIDEAGQASELHALLLDWHKRVRGYRVDKNYVDMSLASTEDILSFALREGLIKGKAEQA